MGKKNVSDFKHAMVVYARLVTDSTRI